MNHKILLILLFCLSAPLAAAQSRYSISGSVTDASSNAPLPGVVVNLDELWAITDASGSFTLERVHKGEYSLKFSLLGYADRTQKIVVDRNLKGLKISLRESSLALEEVVVTAKRSAEGSGTSHNVGREALDHLQMSGITDMAALLPGGKTSNPDLTAQSAFSIRGAGSKAGNAAFSTAVEVDGVRMGNNAAYGEMAGIDTRGVAVDNVESIEVISGVPSVEYGDLGSGIVRIHTKRGRSPLTASFSVNPRTYQASVAKGVEIGSKGGTLNLSGEWARATKKLTSPYESYTRRALSLNYSTTFTNTLRFEAGLSGNLGGMDSKDDPDAFRGEYSKARANSLRANTTLNWQPSGDWITSLNFNAFASFSDDRSHHHEYHSSASSLPAVHAEQLGLNYALSLPSGEYFSDRIVDSRELDFGASLKYSWNRTFGTTKSKLKAGLQYKATGNVGQGEYYLDPRLADNGYRPRPYSEDPFMHNLSAYIEESASFPWGLDITAGLRGDGVLIRGMQYKSVATLSPRFNAKYRISRDFSIRAGWGVSEKLPSFYVLFPKQEYRDIPLPEQKVGTQILRPYYTVPFKREFNPDLRWQRNENAELALEGKLAGVDFSLVGFYNITRNPYKFANSYSPIAFQRDFGGGNIVEDKTFVNSRIQSNGSPIYRSGVELTADFPEIKPLRTSLRLDANYSRSHSRDADLYYFYEDGIPHTSISNRLYQYVGVYPNGGNSNLMINGKSNSSLDVNLTAITHIPEARLIISCRLEASLFSRSINLATGSQEVLYPSYYLDVEDATPTLHPFTEAHKSDPAFARLVFRPTNDALFLQDGYGSYASANLSVTKEIGKKVSLSFFANNFTNSRPYVVSRATGVGAIFTPAFYYGLSCRIKI